MNLSLNKKKIKKKLSNIRKGIYDAERKNLT